MDNGKCEQTHESEFSTAGKGLVGGWNTGRMTDAVQNIIVHIHSMIIHTHTEMSQLIENSTGDYKSLVCI